MRSFTGDHDPLFKILAIVAGKALQEFAGVQRADHFLPAQAGQALFFLAVLMISTCLSQIFDG